MEVSLNSAEKQSIIIIIKLGPAAGSRAHCVQCIVCLPTRNVMRIVQLRVIILFSDFTVFPFVRPPPLVNFRVHRDSVFYILI